MALRDILCSKSSSGRLGVHVCHSKNLAFIEWTCKRILCIIHFVWFLATFPFSVSGFVCLCVFFAASSVINK